MATIPRKYIRTEPPALLTEPLVVRLDRSALAQLNDYRQAQHAWLACTGDAAERNSLHKVMEGFGALLALDIANQAALQLREPPNWAADEQEQTSHIIAAAKAERLAAWEELCSKSVAADDLLNWNTQLMDEVGEMLYEKLINQEEADALLLRAEFRWTAENARPDEPAQ